MNRKVIITLIVMLAIGFAAISTTLIINAVVGIGTNQDSFNDGVVFDEESLTSSDGTTAEISASGRTITFTTQEMKSVGEEAKVNFKIKNYSQYNAVLGIPAISCYYVDNYEIDTRANPVGTTNEYMKLIPGSELDGTTIAAGGGLSEYSSVTVKQIKSYVGDTQTIKFQCEINARATDSETPSIEKTPSYNITFDTDGGNNIDTNLVVQNGKVYGELPTPTKEGYEFIGWYTEEGERIESTTLVNIEENHTLIAKWRIQMPEGYYLTNDINDNRIADIGDEIQVGTESFYVISHTDTELNALAKYNLNVGVNKNPNVTEGLQHETVRGHKNSSVTTYGNVKFSNQNGWPNANHATIDIRNQSYGDGPVKDALYGESGYEKYIQKTIPNSSARLITKGELETLGCSSGGLSCASAPNWIHSTAYWTQSANPKYYTSVWHVSLSGNFSSGRYDAGSEFGVRPVITIPLS